ncbi:MAG TPA: glycosyltransferase family 4 protein [Gemmatimonadales bacterium]|nr:glycosyltransferase family 4 protein [Gemmatimonadales bacterium]
MRSKVLFLDHVGALGGAELALMDVAHTYRDTSTFLLFSDGPFRERLTRLGINVEVIEGGAALHSVRRETGWPGISAALQVMSLAWRTARLARRHDFLHANSQKAFVIACLAGLLARKPVVWDLNDLLLPAHFSRSNIKLDVWLANRFAVRVIANSQASAKALIAQGGNGDKVRVVYNGIDGAPFSAVSDDDIAAARAELRLDGRRLVGVFGRLAEWKGQHIAIEAMTWVPDVHLLLVGDALFGEQPYAERLKAQVTELGLSDRVHFLGFRSDIPRLMRMVDVVLHTSIDPEPFGRVIVEGMLAGRPVIATRAGGVEEILAHDRTGLLIEPGNPIELAEAINRLVADPVRASAIAEAGRDDAERRFTVEANVNAMSEQMEAAVRG